MMVKHLATLIALLVLVAGCSSSGGTADDSVPETTATTSTTSATTTTQLQIQETTTSTAEGTTTLEATEPEPEVGVGVIEFVEVLSELAEDTVYEDLVIEDPEVFVATAFLFCERLAEGEAPTDLLTEYVTNLHDGPVDEAPAEVLNLSGWILGTAVGYLCPEHSDALEELGS